MISSSPSQVTTSSTDCDQKKKNQQNETDQLKEVHHQEEKNQQKETKEHQVQNLIQSPSQVQDQAQSNQVEKEAKKNEAKLICKICSSVILLSNAADSWSNEEKELPLPRQQKLLDTQMETVNGFWIVKDVFSFENAGVTNAVDGKRYLTCADCEYGPIGYVNLKDNSNYLSPSRVAEKTA